MLGLSEVYGAALAAAAGPAAAADVTEHVMVSSGGADTRSLVARTVLHAMRTAPHAAFAPMPAPEREVIALARLARYSVDEIADGSGSPPPRRGRG